MYIAVAAQPCSFMLLLPGKPGRQGSASSTANVAKASAFCCGVLQGAELRGCCRVRIDDLVLHAAIRSSAQRIAHDSGCARHTSAQFWWFRVTCCPCAFFATTQNCVFAAFSHCRSAAVRESAPRMQGAMGSVVSPLRTSGVNHPLVIPETCSWVPTGTIGAPSKGAGVLSGRVHKLPHGRIYGNQIAPIGPSASDGFCGGGQACAGVLSAFSL